MAEADTSICDLASWNCEPCRGGIPPLEGAEIERFLAELGNGWEAIGGDVLQKPPSGIIRRSRSSINLFEI
ncbi:MAG: hypothetical protein H0T92_06355 [Pyrinomonadaceae bacterium]|nr:hypothetical protein [Pyrinomonadaceae bacterium]